MSLDDKFYPNDGSLIDKIDNGMIKISTKILDLVESNTNKTKDDIEKMLYTCTGVGFIAYSMADPGINCTTLILSFLTLYTVKTGKHHVKNNPLDNENVSESRGMGRKGFKYVNLAFAGMGAFSLWATSGQIYAGLLDYQIDLPRTVELMCGGIASVSYSIANYMHQSDYEPPKKKSKLFKWLHNLVPAPEPITSNTYCTNSLLQDGAQHYD